jgi:hypothetical protein
MPQGSLRLPLTDVRSRPVSGTVNVEFIPHTGSSNSGGAHVETGDTGLGGDLELTVPGIPCRNGTGTLYRVLIHSANYKQYGILQRILEQEVNESADNRIRLAVNPGRVREILAPDFAGLPAKLRHFLEQADPIPHEDEDEDIAGLSGADLYGALGSLRKASLLNLFTKAGHGTTERVFQFIEKRTLLVMRQDRFFCTIDPAVHGFLTASTRFKSAPKLLHKPLKGFQLHSSFKSRDDHANIQVTLMTSKTTGEFAADIDIDEASGIEHGFEAFSNIFRGRTNPYLVRELLILTDPSERTLDPGYDFVFK